jgi:hypothetical protein
MNGEFGEDFKPSTKGADHDNAEKHDPFADARSLKGHDSTAKADEKVEAAKTVDAGQHSTEKYVEGSGKEHSDWLAENKTPKELATELERSLRSAMDKMATLTKAGYGEVITGGTFLTNLVKDQSADDVNNFMATIKKYVN